MSWVKNAGKAVGSFFAKGGKSLWKGLEFAGSAAVKTAPQVGLAVAAGAGRCGKAAWKAGKGLKRGVGAAKNGAHAVGCKVAEGTGYAGRGLRQAGGSFRDLLAAATPAKAFLIFVAAAVLVSFLDLGVFKDRDRRKAFKLPEITVPQAEAMALTPAASQPAPAAKSPSTILPLASRNYAAFCRQFGPIPKPQDVPKILDTASAISGTPVPGLGAFWQNESGGALQGFDLPTRTCPVMDELARRDAAKPGRDHSGAMRRMASHFGWNLGTMTCSCPSIDKETKLPRGYGGSCGPFMFSGQEVDDEYALKHDLDPMTFCGGAIIAGWQLRRHYETAKGRGYPEKRAWAWAIRRYAGGADAPCQYDRRGKYKGGCAYLDKALKRWDEIYAWYTQGTEVLHRELAGIAQRHLTRLARYHAR